MYKSRIFKVVFRDGFSLWVSSTGPKHKEMFRYHLNWLDAVDFVFSGEAARETYLINQGLWRG